MKWILNKFTEWICTTGGLLFPHRMRTTYALRTSTGNMLKDGGLAELCSPTHLDRAGYYLAVLKTRVFWDEVRAPNTNRIGNQQISYNLYGEAAQEPDLRLHSPAAQRDMQFLVDFRLIFGTTSRFRLLRAWLPKANNELMSNGISVFWCL